MGAGQKHPVQGTRQPERGLEVGCAGGCSPRSPRGDGVHGCPSLPSVPVTAPGGQEPAWSGEDGPGGWR